MESDCIVEGRAGTNLALATIAGKRVPIISVCIANYNGEEMLRECIDSILCQDVEAKIEIIVHDDASTDGSLKLLQNSFPAVRVIISDQNVGFCLANNRMVDVANGDYLLLLNNDAALGKGALAALLNERLRLAEPCILTLPQHDWETGTLVDRGCLVDPFNNPVPNLNPARSDVAYVIGACLWIDRALWQSLGGFPEWFGSIGEDLYLCGKARLRSVPVCSVEESFYRHRQGASFGGNRIEKVWRTTILRRRFSEQNKTSALFILTPTALVFPMLAIHLLALVAEGTIISCLKRNPTTWTKVYWPAIISPFVNLRSLRKVRNNVQADRTATLKKWFSTTQFRFRKLSLLNRFGFPNIE